MKDAHCTRTMKSCASNGIFLCKVHICTHLTPLGYAGPTLVRGPLGPNGRPGPLKGSDMPSALDEVLNKIIKSPSKAEICTYVCILAKPSFNAG